MLKHCKVTRKVSEVQDTQNPTGCDPEQTALADLFLIRVWTQRGHLQMPSVSTIL